MSPNLGIAGVTSKQKKKGVIGGRRHYPHPHHKTLIQPGGGIIES